MVSWPAAHCSHLGPATFYWSLYTSVPWGRMSSWSFNPSPSPPSLGMDLCETVLFLALLARVISCSWPTGRREIWLPCIQWHISPDLASVPLWGAFSYFCHLGRPKRRSVSENDCATRDPEQGVSCERLSNVLGHKRVTLERSQRTSSLTSRPKPSVCPCGESFLLV